MGHARGPRGVVLRPGVLSLPRALSRAGLATREEARRLVKEGRVRVDGVVVRDPTARVDPSEQRILLDGQAAAPSRPEAAAVVLALNKPRGLLVTRSDPEGRPTVYDLLPADRGLLRCVGRLDASSAGLLLATTDTRLAARMEDPDTGLRRLYRVKVSPRCEGAKADAFRFGSVVDGKRVRPHSVEVQSHGPRSSWLLVTLAEGRNREIRRLAAGAGLEVEHLIRIAYGPIPLGDLKPGVWRELTPDEVASLRKPQGTPVR
jgi:23S rRNA pseudouridine2605 synthase